MNAVPQRTAPTPAGALSSAAVIGFANDPDTRTRIAGVGAEIHEGGIAAARTMLELGARPHLLIIDISDEPSPAADLAALIELTGPTIAIVALGVRNDVGLYRSLVGAGITDYLVKPVEPQELRRTILTAAKPPEEADAASTDGRLAVVIGARGGVGASSITVGVASLLAQEHEKRTVLVDLDLHFGTAALSFDVDPGGGLRNAVQHPDRIDTLFLASALTGCGKNLWLLGGEEPLEEGFQIRGEAVQTLVDELRSRYDLVVLELPRHLAPVCASVVKAADAVAVVTDMTLAGLRDTLRLRSALAALAPQVTGIVVANRVGLSRGGELSLKDFERSINAKVDFVVGEDAKAAKAALEGKPLTASRGPAASLRALARRLGAVEEQATKTRRWFKTKA